jgi:hypothetical protein
MFHLIYRADQHRLVEFSGEREICFFFHPAPINLVYWYDAGVADRQATHFGE